MGGEKETQDTNESKGRCEIGDCGCLKCTAEKLLPAFGEVINTFVKDNAVELGVMTILLCRMTMRGIDWMDSAINQQAQPIFINLGEVLGIEPDEEESGETH